MISPSALWSGTLLVESQISSPNSSVITSSRFENPARRNNLLLVGDKLGGAFGLDGVELEIGLAGHRVRRIETMEACGVLVDGDKAALGCLYVVKVRRLDERRAQQIAFPLNDPLAHEEKRRDQGRYAIDCSKAPDTRSTGRTGAGDDDEEADGGGRQGHHDREDERAHQRRQPI